MEIGESLSFTIVLSVLSFSIGLARYGHWKYGWKHKKGD